MSGGHVRVRRIAEYGDLIMQAEVRSTGPASTLLNLRGQEFRLGTNWSTITVAVTGDHLAAWVDGRQKLDAKLKDPDKTPITIQGTSVAVRNVRVGELPGAER